MEKKEKVNPIHICWNLGVLSSRTIWNYF